MPKTRTCYGAEGYVIVAVEMPDTPLYWNAAKRWLCVMHNGAFTVFPTKKDAENVVLACIGGDNSKAQSGPFIACRLEASYVVGGRSVESKDADDEEESEGVLFTQALWTELQAFMDESIREGLDSTFESRKKAEAASNIYKMINGD